MNSFRIETLGIVTKNSGLGRKRINFRLGAKKSGSDRFLRSRKMNRTFYLLLKTDSVFLSKGFSVPRCFGFGVHQNIIQRRNFHVFGPKPNPNVGSPAKTSSRQKKEPKKMDYSNGWVGSTFFTFDVDGEVDVFTSMSTLSVTLTTTLQRKELSFWSA